MPISNLNTGAGRSSIRKPTKSSNSSISKPKKPVSSLQSKIGSSQIDEKVRDRYARAFQAHNSSFSNSTPHGVFVAATPASLASPAGPTMYSDEMDIDENTESESNTLHTIPNEGLPNGTDSLLKRHPMDSLTDEQKQRFKDHMSLGGFTDFGSTFYKESNENKGANVENEISSLNPDIAHKPESVFKDKGKGRMVEEDLGGNGDSGGNAGSVSEGPEGAVYGSGDEMMID